MAALVLASAVRRCWANERRRFQGVDLMGCAKDQLPLRSRVQAVADEVERDDVYGRHVFYVACTRTRSLVTGLPA